ncbi:hypothetical protein [Megasphaera sp.]
MMNRARIAANGGTISTSVLIYMALHDGMGFGKKTARRDYRKSNGL